MGCHFLNCQACALYVLHLTVPSQQLTEKYLELKFYVFQQISPRAGHMHCTWPLNIYYHILLFEIYA